MSDDDYESAAQVFDRFLHEYMGGQHERTDECGEVEGEVLGAIIDAFLANNELYEKVWEPQRVRNRQVVGGFRYVRAGGSDE